MKVAQLCPMLCDSMDCSPWNFPGQNTGVGSLVVIQMSNYDGVHLKGIVLYTTFTSIII